MYVLFLFFNKRNMGDLVFTSCHNDYMHQNTGLLYLLMLGSAFWAILFGDFFNDFFAGAGYI